MSWIDWCFVVIPLLIVVWVGCKSQKYVKDVTDFLAAGRVAGRYVISVASGEAVWGLISVIALNEMYYNCGFGVNFWNKLTGPLGMILALTGYCVYRFRETRAMTMGQFLEIRYNRPFRVFASILQAISGIVNYAIFPAVGARFLIYFMDIPLTFSIGSWTISTFALTMFIFLAIALFIALAGGQITIMVTDCVQGLLSYPMYAAIVIYILWKLNWWEEMVPVLEARPAGESFLNPFDIAKLRDFNLFYVFVGIVVTILGRMSWSGSQGYYASAKSAHEQKIGGLLGSWRGGFSGTMYVLIAIAAYTYMNHAHFAGEARRVRTELASKTIADVSSSNPALSGACRELQQRYPQIPEQKLDLEKKEILSAQRNFDNAYKNMTREAVKDLPGGKSVNQNFTTIYGQMLVPIALRELFPVGITGIFCAIMLFLMLSTDTTYIHSWGSVLAQDIVMPLLKNPMTPRAHLLLLRVCLAFVCAFAFYFSLNFAQVDYLLMFQQITGAIWMGGASPVIVFGLYGKKGTPAAAFVTLIGGAIIAVGGIVMQSTWVEYIYPWIIANGWGESINAFLVAVSSPFDPYIRWSLTPDKFPINSQELTFLSMAISSLLYFVVSWLTCRKPFNLDKMLHRGIYSDGTMKTLEKFSFRHIGRALLGIDPNYSKGDKVLAWSVLIYGFIYGFVLCFLVVVVWNIFDRWPDSWWSHYFFWTNLVVPCLIAVVTTIWFSIGGTRDLKRLFHDLKNKKEEFSDDGRVE